MSGGFGTSEYLFNEVKKFSRERNIQLRSTAYGPGGGPIEDNGDISLKKIRP